jgi:transposase
MDERTRKILEAESDPRILRGLIASMAEHIKKQDATIARIEAENAKRAQSGFMLEEQVKLLRRSLFGKKSEIREASDRPRDQSQEAALLFSQATFPITIDKLESESKKNKSKGQDLNEQVIEHYLDEAALIEESELREIENPSAAQWAETGFYDQCVKIQIVERSYVKEVHRKMKYKLKPEFNKCEKEIIITASGSAELLPGMNYTTEFVASVIADKFISHLPLERQVRRMESLGLKGIQNSTLSRMAALAASSLESLQERILVEDILTGPLTAHIDETPWKIQNKDQKNGYMWVISSSRGSYYFFEPTRSAKVITTKLKDYDGPVMTDGYKSYDSVLEELEMPRAYCWSHARREFLPLETHDPTVKPILDQIDKIFEIERLAKTFEELAILRKEKSSEHIQLLKELLMSELPRSRGQSQKRKAIEYTLKRWDGLTLFLNDTRIPLSNNEAERTIRHSVVGRKNYYGSGSHGGADSAATLFTVIESCKKNEIDPRSFLIMSLEKVARGEELETPLAYAKRTRSKQGAN